jgi:hypothetical protein
LDKFPGILGALLDAKALEKVARDPEISIETKGLVGQTRAAQLHPSIDNESSFQDFNT